MKRLNIESLLDKYIIVVDGDERKVVYDVDDSRIFSVSVTGSRRGARNAVLSKRTFFHTLQHAEAGKEELEDCFWTLKFKIIKVSELKDLSQKGWDILINDIDDLNRTIDWEREREKERKEEIKKEYKDLEKKALNLIKTGHIYSIEQSEYDDSLIIKVFKS